MSIYSCSGEQPQYSGMSLLKYGDEEFEAPSMTYSATEAPDWQPYRFSGKESLTRVGLNLYDFGARMFSPLNMRWMTMDPLCERAAHISPYVYCSGNPINRIDMDGMFDKKMFWSGVGGIVGGIGLTAGGAATCAGTGGVAAALGTAMMVEGISGICGGVAATVMGCVTDPPEDGKQRFTPTSIGGTTVQTIDLACGNENFEVYNTYNYVILFYDVASTGSGIIRSLAKNAPITTTKKIEYISTGVQVAAEGIKNSGDDNKSINCTATTIDCNSDIERRNCSGDNNTWSYYNPNLVLQW